MSARRNCMKRVCIILIISLITIGFITGCKEEETCTHYYEWHVEIEPTMISDGKQVEYCTYCNKRGNEEIIPKIGYTKELTYELNEEKNGYIVTGLTEELIYQVIIPNKYNDLFVTEIGLSAFDGCSSLSSITIPASVTSIEPAAFSGCSGLTNVYYTGTIEDWCNIKFEGLGANPMDYAEHFYMLNEESVYVEVTEIEIPNTITEIGYCQFYGFDNVTSITIPNSVTGIREYAFSECSSLTSITIPEGVTSIGSSAFWSCSSLSSIVVDENNPVYDSRENSNAIIDTKSNRLIVGCQSTIIPNNVTIIWTRAFYGCSNLTSIVIPASVTSIWHQAFSGCSSLTSIVVDENNPVYDSRENSNAIIEIKSNYLIVGCQSTIIPNSVTGIGEYAFSDCSSLTSITIPDSVTSIGSSAFEGCSSLTSIVIPASVTSIFPSAFSGCSGLTSIVVDENNPVYDSRENSNAIIEIKSNYLIVGCQSTIIPNSVRLIGRYAFEGCSNLKSIIIPKNVKVISFYAFRGCSSLTIYCEAESISDSWDPDWNPSNCPVVWGYTGE